MKKTDFFSALTDIDDAYILESASALKPIHRINRRTGLLIAAALMALMLVACGVYSMYAASSKVKTEEFPDITVSERVEAIRDWTMDSYLEHFNDLMEEHGIAPEDVVDKIYDEYLRNGYYFDEMIVVTKEKAVARIITDADKFTFNVEFVGYFYNEKNDEFKTVSQSTTAQGGKIEIVMIAEKGWECFGGILARNHPENEYDYVMGLRSIKYGLPASVRAMQFEDKYFDEKVWITQHNSEYQVHDLVETVAYWDKTIPEGTFDTIESDDPKDKLNHILSKLEMSEISDESSYSYENQSFENGKFIETGYVYDKNGLIAFVNTDIKEATENSDWFYVCGIFYNSQKDQYRVSWGLSNHSADKDIIMKIQPKEGWECIGVVMFQTMSETEKTNVKKMEGFSPVVGDEEDSYKFFEKLLKERDNKIEYHCTAPVSP